jgi:hypothetical protein
MQTNNRTSFQYLTIRWKTLTDAQRTSWKNLAAISTALNRFGDAYHPTGQMLFIGYNQNLYLVGQPYIYNAPTAESFTEIVAPYMGTVRVNNNLMNLNFPVSPTGSNVSHILYATDSISAGINYVLVQYRQIGVIQPGTDSGINIYNDYVAVFPKPTAEQRVFIYLRPVCIHTGIPGVHSFCNAFVLPVSGSNPIGTAVIGTSFIIS